MRIIASGQMRLAAAVLAAVALAGCQFGAPRQQPASPQAGVVAPPATLTNLQSNAEAMIDSADAGDWTRVSAELASIHQAWTSLRPDLAGRGARSGLLDSVDGAIADLDRQANRLSRGGTANAANRLTAFVPDMMAVYGTTLPPEIAQMRFLAREVGSDAQADNLTAVWDNTRALGTAWAYIRPAAQKVDVGDSSRLDLQIAELDAAVAQATGGMRAAATPAMAGTGSATSSSSASTSGSSSTSPSSTTVSSSSAPRSTASSATTPPAGSSTSTPAPTTRRRSTPAPSYDVSPSSSIGPVTASILDTLNALSNAFQTPR